MRHPRRNAGFTLIEVSVVVTLMGLLVAIALVKLGVGYQRIAFKETIEQLTGFERNFRLVARHTGQRQHVVVDVDAQRVSARGGSEESGDERAFQIRRMGNVRIDSAWIDGERVSSKGEYWIDGRGHTRNVAFCLMGSNAQRRWIVFIGSSGQRLVLDDESDLMALLTASEN